MGKAKTYPLTVTNPRATLERASGKGASLARLVAAGPPVPDGFHVTTDAYRRFVAENALQPLILDAVRAARAAVPREVADAVAWAYAALPGDGPPVAVRSSGTAEDLPELSFAGQQETRLNVRGAAAVLEAVTRCWASLWMMPAIGYRARHGIAPDIVSLAVVVQLLVPAEAAGVLFNANPVSGARDQPPIAATWGLGEALVGGRVTPDTLVVDKASGRVLGRQTADKLVMTVRAGGGTEERPTPEHLRHAPVLSDAQAATLCRLGVQIEHRDGVPMDVEWALRHDGSEGGFAILQARPITALPPAPVEPAAPLAWRRPNPHGKYARSSIIELLPEPLTPLFGTLGLAQINRAYQRFGTAVLGGADGMPDPFVVLIEDYADYDVTVGLRQTLSLLVHFPPIAAHLLRSAETRWRDQARPRYAATVARWQAEAPEELSAPAILDGVGEIVAVALDTYITTVQGGVLSAAYMSEATFSWFYETLVRRPGDPPALRFMLGFDSLPIRAEKSLYDLGQWCRERPALADFLSAASTGAITARLGGGAGPPAEVPPAGWSGFCASFAVHQARFGHAIYDLDFSKPTPADDPTPLLATLQ